MHSKQSSEPKVLSLLLLLLVAATLISITESTSFQGTVGDHDAETATASTSSGWSAPVLVLSSSSPPGTVASMIQQLIMPLPRRLEEPNTTGTASVPFPMGEASEARGAALRRHNHYRMQHGAPELVWGEEQARRAEAYAQKCMFEADDRSSDGQNLFAVTAGVAPAVAVREAIAVWYSGVQAYNWNSPGFTQANGLFTQVVWKSSARLGCGYQHCPVLGRTSWKDVILVVCYYDPAGNTGQAAEYRRNVLPLKRPPGGGKPGSPPCAGQPQPPADRCGGSSPPPRPPPSPPSAQPPALQRHNAYRTQHKVPHLAWSSVLEQQAMVSAARCVLEPDENRPAGIGENLYATAAIDNPRRALVDAVNSWYQQGDNYNYNRPGMSGRTGSFTQLVWKSSRRLGCAAAVCDKSLGGVSWPQGGVLVVCRYSPAGNVVGEFRENVLPRT